MDAQEYIAVKKWNAGLNMFGKLNRKVYSYRAIETLKLNLLKVGNRLEKAEYVLYVSSVRSVYKYKFRAERILIF